MCCPRFHRQRKQPQQTPYHRPCAGGRARPAVGCGRAAGFAGGRGGPAALANPLPHALPRPSRQRLAQHPCFQQQQWRSMGRCRSCGGGGGWCGALDGWQPHSSAALSAHAAARRPGGSRQLAGCSGQPWRSNRASIRTRSRSAGAGRGPEPADRGIRQPGVRSAGGLGCRECGGPGGGGAGLRSGRGGRSGQVCIHV